MLVIDPVEQPECISFFLSRIEYDDFVPIALVVLFIIGQQMAGAQIRIDRSYSIKKHVWPQFIVVNADMPHNTLMQVLIELR